MEKLLKVGEVAELLGMKESTIYAWVNQGSIPYCKIGKAVRFRQTRIEEWIRSKEMRPRSRKTPIDNKLQISYALRQKGRG